MQLGQLGPLRPPANVDSPPGRKSWWVALPKRDMAPMLRRPCAAKTHGFHARRRRGAKLSSSSASYPFQNRERAGCTAARAGRCQLSTWSGTHLFDTTHPCSRRTRQSRSSRRMQGPRTSALNSQDLPGSASPVVQKVKLVRGNGGADPIRSCARYQDAAVTQETRRCNRRAPAIRHCNLYLYGTGTVPQARMQHPAGICVWNMQSTHTRRLTKGHPAPVDLALLEISELPLEAWCGLHRPMAGTAEYSSLQNISDAKRKDGRQ